MRSARCSSWSLRINVCARKARCIGVVGTEQRRVVFYEFSICGLREEGAAHRFDPQYGRVSSQPPVNRARIMGELLNGNRLIERGTANVGIEPSYLAALLTSVDPIPRCITTQSAVARLAERPVDAAWLLDGLHQRGVVVACDTLWRFLKREEITFKKNLVRRRAGSARRRAPPRALAEISRTD